MAKKRSNNNTQKIAVKIINMLRGKMIIHKYNASSTNSVYFKFDYGVANSLRISDHPGYNYLAYRYNIIIGLKEPYIDNSGKFPKEYYPETMAETVVKKIIDSRQEKMNRYFGYSQIVEKQKLKPDHTKSFWKNCIEIK